MSIEQALMQRSENRCELCSSDNQLQVYQLPPENEGHVDQAILTCQTCHDQINAPDTMDNNHWRCLNEAMWKPIDAIQVMSWRLLKRLSSQGEIWAQDLLDMMYLEDDIQQWAQATETDDTEDNMPVHKDSNGTLLSAGDNVTLIKDLEVKGAHFTAKRGTLVKNISLTNNPEQIEGKVNGTQIVLLTKFLKKAS